MRLTISKSHDILVELADLEEGHAFRVPKVHGIEYAVKLPVVTGTASPGYTPVLVLKCGSVEVPCIWVMDSKARVIDLGPTTSAVLDA